MIRAKEGQSEGEALAEKFIIGCYGNAFVAASNSSGVIGKTVEASDAIKVIEEGIERVERGETLELESLLVSQCYSLNALFGRLASRAEQFIDISPMDYELNLKLALKAQSQCRASIETISTKIADRSIHVTRSGRASTMSRDSLFKANDRLFGGLSEQINRELKLSN